MNFKEASTKLESILTDKEITLSEINRFIVELLSNKELNQAELCNLLLKKTAKGLDLGRLVLLFNIGKIWTNKDDATKNYLKVLRKARPPISLFIQESSSNNSIPCFAQLIARHCDSEVIQEFLQLLKDLYYSPVDDTNLSHILIILNQKKQSKTAPSSRLPIEADQSFFEEIANRYLLIDMSPIIEMITQRLKSKSIHFEHINSNPGKFISEVHQEVVAPLCYNPANKSIITQWLALFPKSYHPTNFKLLAFVCYWCERLTRTLNPIGDQTLFIDQNTTAAELALLSACVDMKGSLLSACDSPHRLKTIRITGKDHGSSLTYIDDKLIANLTIILKHVRTIEMDQCEMSHTFKLLFAAARQRAQTMPGYSYQVRSIIICATAIDKLILDEHTGNYTASGFPVGDTSVEELEFRYIYPRQLGYIYPGQDTLKNEELLKFLSSMTKLTTLRLTEFQLFDFSSIKLSVIDQSMRKPGLTSLTLGFLVEYCELVHIIKLLQYNQSLTELNLPYGRFSESNLIELAETLRTSNRTLHTLTLAKGVAIPKQLVDALQNNKKCEIITEKQREIQNTIDSVNQFLSPAHGHILPVELIHLWNKVAKACELINEIMKSAIPPSDHTISLCNKLAISGSQLLLKIMPFLMNYSGHQYMNEVASLGGLFHYLTDPSVKLEFAKNMYAFCSRFYDDLITKFNGVMQDNRLHGCENIAPAMAYAHLAGDISNLIIVLRHFPAEQNLYFHEINNMLFELYKRKIVGTLCDTDNKDILALANKIENEKLTKNISDLFAHLHDFLDAVGDVEQLRVLFNAPIESTKRFLFGNNYILNNRTLFIDKISQLRGEVQRIFIARPPVALTPAPSFIPGKDGAKQTKDVDASKTAVSQSAVLAAQATLPRSAEVDIEEGTPSLPFNHAIKPAAVVAALPLSAAVAYPTTTAHLPETVADNSAARASNFSASTDSKSSTPAALIPPYAAKHSATQDSSLTRDTLLSSGSLAIPTAGSTSVPTAGPPSSSFSGSAAVSTTRAISEETTDNGDINNFMSHLSSLHKLGGSGIFSASAEEVDANESNNSVRLPPPPAPATTSDFEFSDQSVLPAVAVDDLTDAKTSENTRNGNSVRLRPGNQLANA